jgi:DNA-binding transcriptional ArsR family regulator
MNEIVNVYCDESCHLEHDHHSAMVLGAVWCLRKTAPAISRGIRALKQEHGLDARFEIKWTKVSPAKAEFYRKVVDFFFDCDDLHFRALIVPDKSVLDHAAHEQTHDEWYYKMYFDMLKVIIDPQLRYHIYLDIKDTRGRRKVQKLHRVLANANYDFRREIIERIQTVRSHETELLQLADLLIGGVSYVNRGLSGNSGKEALVEHMRRRSGYCLTKTTLLREGKTNLFRWTASESRE